MLEKKRQLFKCSPDMLMALFPAESHERGPGGNQGDKDFDR